MTNDIVKVMHLKESFSGQYSITELYLTFYSSKYKIYGKDVISKLNDFSHSTISHS